jgi:hypothetical protein
LDVVTPDALLAILESREIGQRRRFEQIYEEMTQATGFPESGSIDGARSGSRTGGYPGCR